jgi:hypothetical protein
MPQPRLARPKGDTWNAFYDPDTDTWYRVKEGDPRGTHLLHGAGSAQDPRYPLTDFPEAPPLTDAEKRAQIEPQLRALEERRAYLENELKMIDAAPSNKSLRR